MSRGRVYRRCSCRDVDGRQLGARCPYLADDRKHGTWGFAVDVPSLDGKRRTMRRHRWATKAAAQRALDDVNDRYGAGITVDDAELTGEYLRSWLAGKRHRLKPKTLHGYREYIEKDLIPALGGIRLEQLRHTHVAAFVAELEDAGRGAPTIRRCVAVLSSALADAVRQHRLVNNVARYAPLPPEGRAEREPWTAEQAVRFLEHCHQAGDRLADLFEVLIGTGLRRGEVLALRWADVDLEARVLQVHRKRGTLSDVAGRLVFTAPKTPGSSAGVGLSSRVVAALQRQRARQDAERAQWADAYVSDPYNADGLVFARENGEPLRPEYVLARFHELTKQAGLPRVRLHDCRHLAATLMLGAGVPLPLVSKTLRHANLGITSDLYGHLTTEAAHAAADGLGDALDAAAAELASERAARAATTVRPCDLDREPSVSAPTGVAAGQEVAS